MAIMEQEGIKFQFNTMVDLNDLPKGFDAYIISNGTPTARDLKIPGREFKGVYFALQMLTQQNLRLAGKEFSPEETVSAKGKKVAVIGAGPAGLSASVRLNALGYEVTLFDKMPSAGGLVRYGIPNFKLDKYVIDRRMEVWPMPLKIFAMKPKSLLTQASTTSF